MCSSQRKALDEHSSADADREPSRTILPHASLSEAVSTSYPPETARTRAPFIEGEGPEDPQATAQAQTHIGIPERKPGRQEVPWQSQQNVARQPFHLERRHGWVQQATLTHR